MSGKPERLEEENEEDYNSRLEEWYCKTGNVIYLVKTDKTFNSFQELSEAVKGWDNLSLYVVGKGRIVKLRFHEEPEDKWLIQTVPLEEIAVVMLESSK